MTRCFEKTVIKIPFGEIQRSEWTGRIVVWFLGKQYVIRKPRRRLRAVVRQ